MLKSKSFLGVDFGAGTLKAAEFEPGDGGRLKLVRFATKSLGLAGSQEIARDNLLKKALPELLSEGGFGAKDASICVPGFQLYSKYVKLPAVESSKISQLIGFEAKQNIPYPIEEACWDYQLLGGGSAPEPEVLLVALKADIVEKLLATCESSGLKMDVVEASFAALANAFRYNYSDVEGCSMLIDMGARSTTVFLFEKNKFYARVVTTGGTASNSITDEFAKEVKIPFAEAERIKTSEGFVSLGGAYEEPDNPKIAAVAKIARNVLTKLHREVNQTVQFYRTQQGGSAPSQVFLSGGGSIMPYATQFFQEKLSLPVDYFNPFRGVEIDPSINVAELEKVAQSFGEVVGLGLRNYAQCPLELNLMPKKFLARQEFNAKKPFLLGAAFALAAGAFAYGFYFKREADVQQKALAEIKTQLDPLQAKENRLKSEETKISGLTNELGTLTVHAHEKTYWADILTEFRRALMQAEAASEQKLGRKVGVWIEKLISQELAQADSGTTEESTAPKPFFMDPILMKRYGLRMPGMPTPGGEGSEGGEGGEGGAKKSEKNTNEVSLVNVTLRAMNLKAANPNANNELMFDLQKELQSSALFDAKETKLSGDTAEDDPSQTFTFELKLKLKRPIKL